MKKTGLKRFFSLLLCGLLMLGIFPAASLADHGDRMIDYRTVTFDGNGHGTPPDPATVEYGQAVACPADPIADQGWKFAGWCEDKECTTAYQFSTPVTDNITIYASWSEDGEGEVNYYDVYFFLWPEDEKPISAQSVEEGQTALKPEDPEVPGFIFEGWYTEAECENAFDFDTPITAETKLYAKWTEEVPAFEFTTQPESGTAKKSEDYAYSWELSDTPDSIILQSCFGESWYNSTSLADKSSDAVSFNADVSKYRIRATKGDETIYSDEFTVTWLDDTVFHTVVFDGNGHGTPPASVTVEHGQPVGCPADPTADPGWKFAGWCEDKEGSKAYQFSAPVTDDITIYAGWTEEKPAPVTFTVTFDANGHGTAPAAQTVESGKTASKPADPAASGWTFGGWYKDKECKTAFDFAAPVTENVKLYAKWTQNGGAPVSPKTDDISLWGMCLGMLLVGACGLVALSVRGKKRGGKA